MCQYASQIWCAVSAPVVQGLLVGLGVATFGLVLFPFDIILTRPSEGEMYRYARAVMATKWARRLSWLPATLTFGTLAGYVVIFVWTRGKFCDAKLDHRLQVSIYAWFLVLLATVLAFVGLAVLRRRARRPPGS